MIRVCVYVALLAFTLSAGVSALLNGLSESLRGRIDVQYLTVTSP